MTEETALVETSENTSLFASGDGQFTPHEVKMLITSIQKLMAECMKEGEHYGVIPGCGDKPTLLQPGAEKLKFMFRFSDEYEVLKEDLGNNHREVTVKCFLKHSVSGNLVGTGLGSCSTMESKYRYRQAQLICPECKTANIIKGKAEYGGGWLCFAKKGGCGAKFADEDPKIVKQPRGQMENPDVADQWNTVLKMAKKRALVDVCKSSTAASDIFTQDIEDFAAEAAILAAREAAQREAEKAPKAPKKKKAPAKAQPPAQDPVQNAKPVQGTAEPPAGTKTQPPANEPIAAVSHELLDDDTKAVIVESFEEEGVYEQSLVKVLGANKEDWHTGHREWLRGIIEQLIEGALTAERFLMECKYFDQAE